MLAVEGLSGRWRRHRALVRLELSSLSRAWLARAGRWSAWYLAVAHAALIVWLDATTAVADFSNLVMRALTFLTWSAGAAALAAATDGKWHEQHRWARDLSRLRGFDPRQIEAARTGAAVELVTRPILLPGLAVAGLALCLSDTLAGAFASVLRMFAVGIYAIIAGAVLGLLARWSSVLSPSRPKTVLAAMVVLPYVAGIAFGHVPNVVRLMSAMLGRVARVGGGIG